MATPRVARNAYQRLFDRVVCSVDVLNYVASIFARGDSKAR
jgi:hypothetical protein